MQLVTPFEQVQQLNLQLTEVMKSGYSARVKNQVITDIFKNYYEFKKCGWFLLKSIIDLAECSVSDEEYLNHNKLIIEKYNSIFFGDFEST